MLTWQSALKARGIDVSYNPGISTESAVAAAKLADAAIIFGSAHSSEGHDRSNLLFYQKGKDDRVQHTPMQGSASVNASCTPPVMGIIGRGYVRMIPATSTAECCSACLNDGGCVAYTLSGGSLCFLKDNIDVVSTTATDHHSGAPSPTFYPPSSILLLRLQHQEYVIHNNVCRCRVRAARSGSIRWQDTNETNHVNEARVQESRENKEFGNYMKARQEE